MSSVSIGSRIVPGTGLTRARSSPRRALSSEDLPTLGRPMMARRSAFSSAGASSSGGGSASSTRSRKSPTPIPCCADTNDGSAKPSSRISCAKWRSVWESALFAATTTRCRERRRSWAISRSTGVNPSRTSSKKTMTWAWSIATLVWASIAACDSSFAVSRSRPAVSTTVNSRPRQSAIPYNRSRVSPDCGSTMALRQPRMRLKSVDFPTLGRPTMATIGRGTVPIRPVSLPPPGEGARPRSGRWDGGRSNPEPGRVSDLPGKCLQGLLDHLARFPVGASEDLPLFDLSSHARDDQVEVVGPGLLGVPDRRIGRVVGMAVVVADDVEAGPIAILLDRAVLAGIDLIRVARALGVCVRRSPGLRDVAGAFRGHQHPADLVGVALGHVGADRVQCRLAYLHLRPYRPVER